VAHQVADVVFVAFELALEVGVVTAAGAVRCRYPCTVEHFILGEAVSVASERQTRDEQSLLDGILEACSGAGSWSGMAGRHSACVRMGPADRSGGNLPGDAENVYDVDGGVVSRGALPVPSETAEALGGSTTRVPGIDLLANQGLAQSRGDAGGSDLQYRAW
jgi:hypothetical protein